MPDYTSIPVLEQVNLTVPDGRIFGIVGHSGAGKFTLLRCISGLEHYDGGSLLDFRRNMGMIFQSFALLAHKSVLENICLITEQRLSGRMHAKLGSIGILR